MDTDKDIETETLEDRLQKARAAKDERDRKRATDAKALELQRLELEEKYEAELGPVGVKFAIVSNALGNFVLKLGDFVTHKRFNAKGKDVTEEDVFALVRPSIVFPDPKVAMAIFTEHAGIAWDCALALQGLYAGKKNADAGK